MKMLVLATMKTNAIEIIQKVIETLPKNRAENQVIICLLGERGDIVVQMPKEVIEVIALPPIEKFVMQATYYVKALKKYCEKEKIDVVAAYADQLCQQVAGMLSEKLDWQYFTQVTKIEEENKTYLFYRKVYDANLEAVFKGKNPFVVTIARGKCTKQILHKTYKIRELELERCEEEWGGKSRYLEQPLQSELESTNLLFVVGRGIGNRENVERVKRLAKQCGGAMGATRAVVLNGWVPSNYLIGQSGIIAAPDLCVTFGVSGAGPLIVGIEGAKKIIAINNDTSAAIFNVATHGVLADCNSILEEMERLEEGEHV